MNVRNPLKDLIEQDPRYGMEAYQFVREGLTYAQEVLQLGSQQPAEEGADVEVEQHISGQQLCEAIREYAIEQYGFMAPTVLRRWGITTTSDFGEIVYNLINAELMKKSKRDQREDFNDVYSFEEAFRERFEFPDADEPS